MFRKPLPVTGTHKLGGSDVKRLKKELAKKLRLDPDDAEAIVGGKKSVLELVKSPAPSRVQIYLSDGAPVVIDHSGKGDYELTYFALWRAPGALGEPVVLRHCAVTRYLVRGADLMLPGVGRVPSTAVPFGVGKLFAVTVPGNPTPLAVGETCVGSAEFGEKESSGKFLLIRSCYRDALWAMAAAHPARPPLLPNEGFLEKGVVGAEESEHDAGLALDEDEEDEEDDDDGGGGGGGGGALPPNALVETSVVETSVVETHETVDAMDARIDAAFAYAIARRVKNADLPAPSSSFWGRHVSPSRAAGAPPPGARRGPHKKMYRVFAAFAKRGWLTGKEDPRTKEFVVTSVRRTHADIEKFLPSFDSTFETAGDAEARERSDAERDADARASMYTGAAAAAFAAEHKTSIKRSPLVLERRFRVPASALGVFQALAEAHGPERFPCSPDTLYTREGAAAVAEAYCDLADLAAGAPSRAHITLDAVLCDALFKGVLRKGDPYPTHAKRQDALGETWLGRFHPVTFVSRGARSATKKGDLAPVRVESERRGGDRKVTRVLGFETYLIEPEELRETLARTLATNCQVADLEATKNRAPGAKAIVAAGNAVEKTRVTLREHYGVPDANIVTKDVFNGKGKNK
jgi:translation initiation factor 2D